jgi:filamentous hemagglutinin family protein
MNRNLYRTRFNTRSRMRVAVAEILPARGKGAAGGTGTASSARRPSAAAGWSAVSLRAICLAAASSLWVLPALAAPPLPSGGTIVAGTGSISQSGNTLTVNQSSASLTANWQSFDIASGNTVIFHQPGSSSVALNRVTGSDASTIYGSLIANGQVFLVNPNGVLFAPGAQVSVGGLVASTLNISDADFAAGHYRFAQGSTGAGSVVNQGSINAGSAVLIAPGITNSGTISTPGGQTTLAAGQQVTVNLLPNGLLTAQVDVSAANAQIQNHGRILADGGGVALVAGRSDTVADSLINTDGVIEAHSIRNVNGAVYLDGGAGGTVTMSGTVDASGSAPGAHGGNVTVLGKDVGLMAGATVNASGDAGGGTVLVGGNWQGGGEEKHAQATYMDPSATIHADATAEGDGGKVVLWSDDYTGFYGNISARGGAQGGDGGNVETSSHGDLQAVGGVDATAVAGAPGKWLLDPASVMISSSADSGGNYSGSNPNVFTPTSATASVSTTTIQNSLNQGTSVTIQTSDSSGNPTGGSGTITIAGGSTIAMTGSTPTTLILDADSDILVNAGTSITSTNAALNLVLDAHFKNNQAAGSVQLGTNANSAGITINTNGGDITIGGGSNPLTTAAIGDPSTGASAGVFFSGPVSMNAGGGDISIRGAGGVPTVNAPYPAGVQIGSQNGVGNTQITTTGNGTIAIVGTGGTGSNTITPTGIVLRALQGNLTISSGSGAIAINGTEGAGGTQWLTGLYLDNDGAGYKVNIYSNSGPVALIGTAANSGNSAITSTGTVNLGWDGTASNIGTGNLAIEGQTSSGSSAGAGGIAFSAATSINGNGGTLTIGSTGAGGNGLSGLTLSSGLFGAGATWGSVTIGDAYTGPVVENAALTSSGNINITSGAQIGTAAPDITIGGAITESGSNAAVTVDAARNIIFNSGANVSSTSAAVGITLDAHYTSNSAAGYASLNSVTFNSNGGNITIGGGSLVDSGGNPISAIGIAGLVHGDGLDINSSTLSAGGGNVVINGHGASGTSSSDWAWGIDINGSTINTTGAGTVTLNGTGGSGSAGFLAGIYFGNYGNTVSTASGALTLNGTGGSGAGGYGVWFRTCCGYSNTTSLYSSSGPLTLRAITPNAGLSAIGVTGASINLGWNGGSTVGTGNLTILAQTPTTSTVGANGLALAGITLKGNGGNLTIGSTGGSLAGITLPAGAIAAGATWGSATIGDAGTGAIADNGNTITASGTIGFTGSSYAFTGANTLTSATLSFGNASGIANSGTLTLSQSSNTTIGNVISGTGSLVQAGASTLTLTGANTYAGTTTVSGGTLQVGAGGTTGTLGAGAVVDNSSLVFDRSDTVSLSALAANAAGITGTGNVSALIGGGLTVDRPIALTGASSSILLEAGDGGAAGTASGGDVTLSSAISTSAGGTVTVFSGDPGTAAYEARISGASGTTRYKTYGASASAVPSAVAGTRNYYYRAQPSLTVSGLTGSKTYDGLTDASAVLNGSGAVVTGSDGDQVGYGNLAVTAASFDSAHAGARTVSASFMVNPFNYSSGGITWWVSGYGGATGSGSGTVTPRALTVGINPVGKTYDGLTSTTSTLGTPSGFAGNDSAGGVGGMQLAFDDPNAGTRNIVASGTGTLIGFVGAASGNGSGVGAGNQVSGLASDYTVGTPSPASAVISPAALTVTANDDAKIVTQSDPAGYEGASFSGFVDGQDPSVLSGALTITRSNAGTETAGTYDGVLVPSGYTSGNYRISYVNGNFQILPAQQLLVQVQNVSTAYGSSPDYIVSSAEYLDGNGSTFHTLTETAQSGNTYTFSDGVGGSVTFTLTPQGAVTSNAGHLAVGNYALSGSSTRIGGNNFLGLTFIGNQSVTPIPLTPAASGGVSKVYDGTDAMTGLTMSLTGELTGDRVEVNASGTFGSKNAGGNLTYAVDGMSLIGADAADYYLAAGSFSGNNGTITPKPITVSGITADDKVYDGTTVATLTTLGATLNGVISGDAVALDALGYGASFGNRNVGAGKAVTVTGLTLEGADAGNYSFSQPTGLTANITPRPLTITAVSNTKSYDGTTSAAGIPLVSGSLAPGDSFATLDEVYGSKAVGSGLTLIPFAAVADGNGGQNYALTFIDNGHGIIELPSSWDPGNGSDSGGIGGQAAGSLTGANGASPGVHGDSGRWLDAARGDQASGGQSGAGLTADAAALSVQCERRIERSGLLQVSDAGLRLPAGLARSSPDVCRAGAGK